MVAHALGGARVVRFDLDGELVEAAAPLDHELVVRRDVGQADEHRLDLRRIDVDAADDQHVVVAPGDALEARVRGRRRSARA